MSSLVSIRRPLAVLALLGATFLGACLDIDPTPRPVPTFTRMRLTFAATGGGTAPQTVEITRSTGAISGGLSIPTQGGTITVTYLNVDGTEDSVLKKFAPEYETRMYMVTGSNVQFDRSNQHAMVATRTGTGGIVGTAHVQLWDLAKREEVVGADMQVTTPP